jgi:hypothetical protein
MRCRRFLVVMLCLCWWGAAAESGAAPWTVAYLDSTTGREWAQLTGSTGFYWWEVDAVCANNGSVACTANLGTVEVAGWTWAITSQVMDLLANVTDLDTSQLSRFEFDPAYGTVYRPLTVSEVDSTWAPQFLATFSPTLVTATFQAVMGWAADGIYFDPRSAFMPAVIDAAAGGIDTAGRGNLVDSGAPLSPRGDDAGIWLFRSVTSVPEPSSVALLAVGGALATFYRRRPRALGH